MNTKIIMGIVVALVVLYILKQKGLIGVAEDEEKANASGKKCACKFGESGAVIYLDCKTKHCVGCCDAVQVFAYD